MVVGEGVRGGPDGLFSGAALQPSSIAIRPTAIKQEIRDQHALVFI
jgi:hypothetical protein